MIPRQKKFQVRPAVVLKIPRQIDRKIDKYTQIDKVSGETSGGSEDTWIDNVSGKASGGSEDTKIDRY